MKKYYPEIDKLRGIAIIMVMLYHAVIVYPINLHEVYWCRLLYDFLWYMEMPLFFIISGFCSSYQEGMLTGYMMKKGKRLLIPHFVFGLIEILPRIIPNPLVNGQMPAGEALRKLLLYGGEDWFLWTLFLLSAGLPLIQKVYRKGYAGKIVLFIGSVIFYYYSYRMTNLFLIQMWAWFLLYFTIGYFLRQSGYERWKETVLRKPMTAVFGFIMMAAVFWWNSIFELNRLLTVAGVLGGACFFWFAAYKSSKAAGSFLLLCGKYSLPMYLLGGYALVASRTLLVSILGVQQPAVVILFNVIIDIALTLWISRYILERFRLLRTVSGMN